MSPVTSFELSKALYELSGWDTDAIRSWLPDKEGKYELRGGAWYNKNPRIPAYDLGYLLRNLPSFYFVYKGKSGETWYAAEVIGGPHTPLMQDYDGCEGETPENALCLLAIELFKQGVLEREG